MLTDFLNPINHVKILDFVVVSPLLGPLNLNFQLIKKSKSPQLNLRGKKRVGILCCANFPGKEGEPDYKINFKTSFLISGKFLFFQKSQTKSVVIVF